jgi:uncharacterized surface protein with fasciclin (FAS1) repeats
MRRGWMGLAVTTSLVTLGAGVALAAGEPVVGGEAMFPTKDIIDNAVQSADHTALVTAINAAGLVQTLESRGPFTVFAPTNAAFKNLPAGTLESLLKPENRDRLAKILIYHVVSGKWTADDLVKAIQGDRGKAALKTFAGGTLVAELNGPKNIVLVDENGGKANISTYDVFQSNGVIHVIDRVMLPR